VLILTQDRCTVCANCTIGSEIILDAHDELLGDVSHVESRFALFGYCVNVGPFVDSANLDARYEHGLCLTYHRLENHFGCT
jgi:hypothetical protein